MTGGITWVVDCGDGVCIGWTNLPDSHNTHRTMTNSELSLNQLKGISGGSFRLLAQIAKAFVETSGEIDKAKRNEIVRKKLHVHYWIHGLPLRMRFPKSKLYESIFTPIIIGLLVGFIAAIMGIGGAFILVPAMIYIIKMPTKLVPGTSLFVTIFVSVIVTFLHSFNYGSIDLLLVLMLIVGSIIGVQLGQKLGERIDSSGLRALLAILLLIVGIAIAYDTFFADQITNGTSNSTSSDLNFFSQFIIDFSKEMPFFYGLFTIMFAVILGVGAAFIRRFVSNLRKKLLVKS